MKNKNQALSFLMLNTATIFKIGKQAQNRFIVINYFRLAL